MNSSRLKVQHSHLKSERSRLFASVRRHDPVNPIDEHDRRQVKQCKAHKTQQDQRITKYLKRLKNNDETILDQPSPFYTSDSILLRTKRFPLGSTSRPLMFMRPYAKYLENGVSLEKTKTQLYEQVHKYSLPIVRSTQIQYMTEYGDQFPTEVPTRVMPKKHKSLNVQMLRDKILKRTRGSKYLDRLEMNFVNLQ